MEPNILAHVAAEFTDSLQIAILPVLGRGVGKEKGYPTQLVYDGPDFVILEQVAIDGKNQLPDRDATGVLLHPTGPYLIDISWDPLPEGRLIEFYFKSGEIGPTRKFRLSVVGHREIFRLV